MAVGDVKLQNETKGINLTDKTNVDLVEFTVTIQALDSYLLNGNL